jgi:hypothetical protein
LDDSTELPSLTPVSHPGQIDILDDHDIVVVEDPVRDLPEEVEPAVSDTFVEPGNLEFLLLVTPGTICSPS